MDNIILQLLREWPELEEALNSQLHALPGYGLLKAELEEAVKQLESALGDSGRDFYLNFEDADNTMASLCRTAAFLCGFRLCSRLTLQLLTA